MHKHDVIIIGAGLGGLLCGYLLSKEGYDVCILEKNNRIGGCLQSFARNGVTFNTGFNYTESLGDGEVLNKYFSFFDLIDKVKFNRLSLEGYDRISFKEEEKEYYFAQGHNNFIETLAKDFPQEREALKRYITGLEEIVNTFPMYKLENYNATSSIEKNISVGVDDFLKSITKNERLQNVLAGTNSLYGGIKNKTPLYVHALINYSFIKSAWRIVDGGSKLASKISFGIKDNGGTILKNKKVTKIDADNKTIFCDDGLAFTAEKIISNLHPNETLKLVDSIKRKKAYRERIGGLTNSIGMFTLYIVLKKDTFKYQNYNNHHYKYDNVWTSNYENWPEHYMLYTPSSSKVGEYANGVTILTYMRYDEVKKWATTSLGNRNEEYEEFKHKKAEQLLDFVEKKFPHIRSSIEKYYTSTPLTYTAYTGTPQGSSYGVIKDYRNPLRSLILPKSSIPNLYFTGQNLNMHGILGVSIGAVSTCAEFLGMDYLLNKIRKA